MRQLDYRIWDELSHRSFRSVGDYDRRLAGYVLVARDVEVAAVDVTQKHQVEVG